MTQPVTDSSLSIMDLVLKADSVIMGIMLLLLIASIVSWAIIFERSFALMRLKQNFNKFEKLFFSGVPLESLQSRLGTYISSPVEQVFIKAMNERDKCIQNRFDFDFSKQQIDNVVNQTAQNEVDKLEGQTGFLATVGSVAPFVGLFGTVWGIMNSFTAIANTNNTSLSVVAPGIAEALFVTAMGLAVAIPAVIAYNKINQLIDSYYNKVMNFSQELSSILNKHLYQKIHSKQG